LYPILAAFANESLNNNAATTCEPLYKNLHQLASQRVPLAAKRLRSTNRCRQQPLPLPVAIDFMKFVFHDFIQRPARRLRLSFGR
jgi:hypothetical protein